MFSVLLILGILCGANTAPLAKKFVDMTHTLDETTIRFPGIKEFKLDVLLNDTNENGIWVQVEDYSSGIHVGTHMDAPAHFAKGQLTVENIPVSRFMAPAAVVDITAKAIQDSDAVVTVEDLQNWETTTNHNLNGTIVLMRSGWGQKWPNRTAYHGTPTNDKKDLHWPGFSAEAATWLVENRDIFAVGVDTLSIDKGNDLTFPVHRILYERGIYGLENVAKMEELPIFGAKLYVLPVKIGKASGAPTRIVATYPEVIFDRFIVQNNEISV